MISHLSGTHSSSLVPDAMMDHHYALTLVPYLNKLSLKGRHPLRREPPHLRGPSKGRTGKEGQASVSQASTAERADGVWETVGVGRRGKDQMSKCGEAKEGGWPPFEKWGRGCRLNGPLQLSQGNGLWERERVHKK